VALKWRQLFVNTLIDLASYYFKDDRLIMIVSIRSSLSSIPEWAMLELNGELILPPNDIENRVDAKDSLELGSLAFQADSTPIMIVGGHELKGSIVKLQNPFAILKKRIQPEGPIDYEVVGVVSKKLLFDQYPKSIMR
jgi:chromosome transmission fidelity protein 8